MLESAEETGSTFIENALIKARHASTQTGLSAIADDSGLVVAGLSGEPGIRSARYAGENADADQNNRLLLQNLFENTKTLRDTTAYFCAVLVYIESANDPTPEVSIGTWHGNIVRCPRGSNGFGYDPIFMPVAMNQTAAELHPDLKNRLSHRANAAEDFVNRLMTRLRT